MRIPDSGGKKSPGSGSATLGLTKSTAGKQKFEIGMHRISGWPDIRPDNPAFFDIWYPAGYQIALPDIR
jgi:hypothetical protein